MPGKIPDRWEAYTSLGKAIEGTRFITFKVPLEKRMTSTLPKEEQFTPEDLVERIKADGHTLGLVIDLTNTKRYYPSQAMIQQDVQYAKIFTEGHVVPSDKVISKFFRRVDKFVNDDSNADKLVGVHCTHGVNRTGYLVCRYMIDKLDFEPEKALEACSAGRGYPVERENYIEDLKKGKRTISAEDLEENSDGADEDTSWRTHPREHHPRNGGRFEKGGDNRQEPTHQHHASHHDREFHNGHYPAAPAPREQWGGREQWSGRAQQSAGWGSSLQTSNSSRSYGYSHRQSGGWNEQGGQASGGWGNGHGQGGWGQRDSHGYGDWSQQGAQRQYGQQKPDNDYKQKSERYRGREPNHRQTPYEQSSRRRPSTDEYKKAGWRTRGNQDLS